MSAEWQTQASDSWKISLPCTRAEADALLDDVPALAPFHPAPVLMTTEPDPARPDEWRIDVYVEGRPGEDLIAAVRSLASAGASPTVEQLEDRDWVTRSQAFLQPIRAGRFYVHTAAHADAVPDDAIPFLIEASRAFGTGHHETTTGCLEMLDRLAERGVTPTNIADIGTGTGLLAFGARALWPDARFLASDIDPISIEVVRTNLTANHIPDDAIVLVAADGVDHPVIAGGAPYDLLIANILAGPLIALAPSFAAVVSAGGRVMLAGLLASQEAEVVQAYEAQGFRLDDRHQRGDWPTLLLVQQL